MCYFPSKMSRTLYSSPRWRPAPQLFPATAQRQAMDSKGRERGILKVDPRLRVVIDSPRSELTPQGSCEQPPASPQPSVDRLSVTWAEPGSMSSSGVNLFHLPSETPVSNEVKFSPTAGGKSSSLLFLLNFFLSVLCLRKDL
ncbi:uncharacterized protein LOC113499971 [Trichoplusia ni]|uniref:Uncharacterized protein LOC113499971 n=1 Tax=Trichoplusia ni TaxID=7111 RepID=A0A7E5W6X4_TRINI|nr:uncharacterized protein LOC113499971 [Trichoplusia ni]